MSPSPFNRVNRDDISSVSLWALVVVHLRLAVVRWLNWLPDRTQRRRYCHPTPPVADFNIRQSSLCALLSVRRVLYDNRRQLSDTKKQVGERLPYFVSSIRENSLYSYPGSTKGKGKGGGIDWFREDVRIGDNFPSGLRWVWEQND